MNLVIYGSEISELDPTIQNTLRKIWADMSLIWMNMSANCTLK